MKTTLDTSHVSVNEIHGLQNPDHAKCIDSDDIKTCSYLSYLPQAGISFKGSSSPLRSSWEISSVYLCIYTYMHIRYRGSSDTMFSEKHLQLEAPS